MAYWIKHKFQTAKADGTDVTLVKPTNWNDEHEVWMEEGTSSSAVRRDAGSGPGESIPITSLTPAGMIMPYAGSVAPAGWLPCDGASLLRADYAGLFAVIGSTYGAVDAAHFSLPDLRGRTIAGVDAGAGRIGAAVGGALGNAGGQEMVQYYADVAVGGTMYGYATGSLSVRVAMNTRVPVPSCTASRPRAAVTPPRSIPIGWTAPLARPAISGPTSTKAQCRAAAARATLPTCRRRSSSST